MLSIALLTFSNGDDIGRPVADKRQLSYHLVPFFSGFNAGGQVYILDNTFGGMMMLGYGADEVMLLVIAVLDMRMHTQTADELKLVSFSALE